MRFPERMLSFFSLSHVPQDIHKPNGLAPVIADDRSTRLYRYSGSSTGNHLILLACYSSGVKGLTHPSNSALTLLRRNEIQSIFPYQSRSVLRSIPTPRGFIRVEDFASEI